MEQNLTQNRESLIFYRSFYEAIKELPPENQLEIYTAIFELGLNFQTIDLKGLSKTVFTLIKPQIEANLKRYMNGTKAKTKQNGSKNEAKTKQTIYEVEANKNVNVNVNVNDNDNNNVNVALKNQTVHKKTGTTQIGFDFSDFSEGEIKEIKNWLDYRKSLKKAYKTQLGLNALRNNLIKIKKDHGSNGMLAAIALSMTREWQDVYFVAQQVKSRITADKLFRCNSNHTGSDTTIDNIEF